MPAEKNYTSRLGAGLGMIHETLDLLRLWQPGLTPLRLAKHALDAGLFSRTTARRNEDLAVEMFAPRYLVNGGRVASRLKFLPEHCEGHPYLGDRDTFPFEERFYLQRLVDRALAGQLEQARAVWDSRRSSIWLSHEDRLAEWSLASRALDTTGYG